MGTTRRIASKRLLAVALTAVTLLWGAGAGVSASAASTPSYGNIDTSQTGSIIIHKHVQQTSTNVTGSPDGSTADIPSAPVADVVFTAYPITSLPLGTASSWDTLSTLSAPSTACDAPSLAGQTLGTGIASAPTDATGLTTISTPVAAYLVCETSAPSTVVDKAQPFVVTIPFPDNSASNGWLYNVNVYPKNGVANVTKTVTSQSNLGLGATASFPVTTDVPKIADNASFTHYWVQDVLDSRLTGGTVSSVTVDGTPVDSSYYTVQPASSANGNLATVAFTSTGLAWLKTQSTKQVVTTFTGTVASLGNGVVNNTAYFSADTAVQPAPPTTPTAPPTTPTDPQYPGNPEYPGTPSNEVTQNWGDLKINKVDAGDSTTGLTGATFEVYAATDPYASDCSAATPTGSAISVNGSSTFTSTNGAVTIAGLFVSDSQNAPTNNQTRCYVVKETQAPAGFVTPTGTAALTSVTARVGVTSGFDATISNTKQNVPALPLTGASAQLIMTLLGVALLLVAGGIILKSQKRSKQQHN